MSATSLESNPFNDFIDTIDSTNLTISSVEVLLMIQEIYEVLLPQIYCNLCF